MDSSKSRFRHVNLYDSASFISRIFLTYLIPLLTKAVKNDGLSIDDLYRCSVDDKTENVMRQLVQNWKLEKQKDKPSLPWAIVQAFAKRYAVAFGLLAFSELYLKIIQTLYLSQVISHFSGDSSISYYQACVSAFAVCLCTLLFVLIDRPLILHLKRLGMRVRTACSGLIYHKTLKLSQTSIAQTQIGHLTNLIGNDLICVDDFAVNSAYFVIAPIQSAIIICIVWSYLGPSCLAGVVLMLLYIVFQTQMGQLFATSRLGVTTFADKRLNLLSELVSGIRIVKMFCLERVFKERIIKTREHEILAMSRSFYLKAINLGTYLSSSRLILFACFVVCVLSGHTALTAEAVFVSMALFNTLRMGLTFQLPQAVAHLAELKVTFQRIETFLMIEEIGDNVEDEFIKKSVQPSLNVRNISVKWKVSDKKCILKNISLSLKPGDLLAIIGPVGTGKSAFLLSLLNELPLESGQLDCQGSAAYCSQSAFCFNDTIRNNILFGMDFDKGRYRKVIDACALQQDFNSLPLGDFTLAGERGAFLSGGQKLRIGLARAAYREADIFLLDDPLSAVDASVAKHLFQKCINGFLKNKIRVLVTHQMQFIEKATKVLLLDNGQCPMAYGTVQEVQAMGLDFVSLIGQGKCNDNERISETSHPFEVSESQENSVGTQEPVQQGFIKWHIYTEYIRAGAGPMLLFAMFLLTILSQSMYHATDIFLIKWTKHDGTGSSRDPFYDIPLYSIMIIALFITTICRAMAFFKICNRASKRLHDATFTRLLRAPVAFFDTNSTGHILDVLGKDMTTVDQKIPTIGYDFYVLISQAIGVVVTIAIANWLLLIPAIVLAVVIVFLRQLYVKATRDLKRLENITRSPVYAHIGTTMDGIVNIRAFRMQEHFKKQFYARQDDHISTWFLFLSASRAMGMAMDLCCALFICATIAVVMLSQNITGGTVGLIISSALQLAGSTQYSVRQSAELESQMTSVERIVQYQNLKQETSDNLEMNKCTAMNWPQFGRIEFDNLSIAYECNQGSPVLKRINCTIEGGEKVTVIGRTGAGKSSLVAALFRLVEPCSGAIRIDDIDIQTIALSDLRKKIAVIPQDPFIFSESVRFNLDPLNEFADRELWSVLEEVQMRHLVEKCKGKLLSEITECGLSAGQRQLICLARAVLRGNRILVLDEATANVDHQTESLIQATIRRKLASCTVLTIAHRVHSAIDCDRVMVIENGSIIEFDTPQKLLHSSFSDLYRQNAENVIK